MPKYLFSSLSLFISLICSECVCICAKYCHFVAFTSSSHNPKAAVISVCHVVVHIFALFTLCGCGCPSLFLSSPLTMLKLCSSGPFPPPLSFSALNMIKYFVMRLRLRRGLKLFVSSDRQGKAEPAGQDRWIGR